MNNAQLRVLWIIDYFPRPSISSTGVWAFETVQALRADGVNVAVLVPTPWIPRLLAVTPFLRNWTNVPFKTEIGGVPVYYVPCLHYPRRSIRKYVYWQYPWFDTKLVWPGLSKGVDRIIREFAPQIIHANFVLPNGYFGVKIKERFGLPLVVHERSKQALKRLERFKRSQSLYRQVVTFADALITMNSVMASELSALSVDKKHMCIVRSGGTAATQDDCEDRPSEYRDAFVIVCAGSFLERKKQIVLVDALKELLPAVPDARVIFIGDGSMKQQVEKHAAKVGVRRAITFKGRLPHRDVMRCMSWCDVFVLPSTGEASGTVYSEAMAHGKPVVLCSDCGLAEVVKDGQEGYVIPPDDSVSLAEVLRRMAGDSTLVKRMGISARLLFEHELNYRAVSKKIIGVYNCIKERQHA